MGKRSLSSLEKETGNLLHLYPTPLVHYEDIFLRPEISLVSIISKNSRPAGLNFIDRKGQRECRRYFTNTSKIRDHIALFFHTLDNFFLKQLFNISLESLNG